MDNGGTAAKVFIGSSGESLQIAEYLQMALDDHFETSIWNQGVFGLTQGTLQSLLGATKRHDYAVLVLTADDLVTKRGATHTAPRDNTVFEFGLFLGALGPERTFMLHPRDAKVDLPSDLLGVTAATFRQRSDGNLQAAIQPAAVQIRDAILRHAQENAERPLDDHGRKGGMSAVAPVVAEQYRLGAAETRVLGYVRDLVEGIATGRAGVAVDLRDETDFRIWARNLLAMLRDLFASRQTDVYTIWLRPNPSSPSRLKAFLSSNWPEHDHYQFLRGEGMAGKVWETAVAAVHSRDRPHPWWLLREGCDNKSYICVPVGAPAGSGGVLAIGSDQGFDVQDGDVAVTQLFGALLALTAGLHDTT